MYLVVFGCDLLHGFLLKASDWKRDIIDSFKRWEV
jgi:hypothetical protein